MDEKVLEFLGRTADWAPHSEWLNYAPYGMEVYVRVGVRKVPWSKTPVKCFDVANVNVEEQRQGLGIFSRWMTQLHELLLTRGFAAIRIENVLNPRLADKLRRHHWVEVTGFSEDIAPTFLLPLQPA